MKYTRSHGCGSTNSGVVTDHRLFGVWHTSVGASENSSFPLDSLVEVVKPEPTGFGTESKQRKLDAYFINL